MPRYEIEPPVEDKIYPSPSVLKRFDTVHGTYMDEVGIRLNEGTVVALGGLSLVGEEGHPVADIGILGLGTERPDGYELRGWSLQLGHPDPKLGLLRYFDTESGAKDLVLPIPNCATYFACEADPSLLNPDADPEVLKQIVYFVSQFISDEGPPEGFDW